MRTLALNSKNIIDGTGNSQLQYNFPSGSIVINEGDQLALASVSMYNSVYNFTSALNNNTFTYTWIDGTVTTVTIPDSFLDVDGLNDFLHQTMLNRGHYLIEDSTGNFVWFITIQINVSIYAIQIQAYPMNQATYPTIAGATKKYTVPTGTAAAWIPQTANITPYITIPSTDIRTTLGLKAGYYPGALNGGTSPDYNTINTISGTSPGKTQVSTYSAIQTMTSQSTPQITALTSYIVTCSLINNNYSIPNTLLSAFPPSAAFANQFTFSPNEMSFIDTQPGSYGSFLVQFYDQNLRQIEMEDSQIVILLVIRTKNERS
jgi:hypothetical protein